MKMLREIKPKNARSARALAKRVPLLIENSKKTLFLKSTSSSSLLNSLVTDIYSLKKPLSVRFSKKNTIHPFEDPSSLEFFSQKNDTSLLSFASHSKKRPHCLTFTRCFDGKVLDMLECLVQPDTARTLAQFGGAKCRTGIKPLLSFSGTQFENTTSEYGSNTKFALAKSMFLDFFRGADAKEMDVEGLQIMINFIAVEEEVPGSDRKEMVYMRVWRLVTRRSGQKLPRIEVEEMGPRIDFRLGRVIEADEALLKESLKRAKGGESKPKKNIDTDVAGDKIGRIHLGRQDLDDMQTRKMKGLKRARDTFDEEVNSLGTEEDSHDGTPSSDGDEMRELIDGSKSNDSGGREIDMAIEVKRQRVQ